MQKYLALILVTSFLSCSYDREKESKSIKTTTDNDWKNVTTITWEDLEYETKEVWSDEYEAICLMPVFSKEQFKLNGDTIKLRGSLMYFFDMYIFTSDIVSKADCYSGEEHLIPDQRFGHKVEIIDTNNINIYNKCFTDFTMIGILHMQDTSFDELEYSLELIKILD